MFSREIQDLSVKKFSNFYLKLKVKKGNILGNSELVKNDIVLTALV